MATKKETEIEARVLSRCQYGDINQVIKLSKAEAKHAESLGLIDTHPSAVKLAKQIKG